MAKTATHRVSADDTIEKLTTRGREFMRAVGKGELSFFDKGVTEGSGSWIDIMAEDFGFESLRAASGVMNGTRKLGLWEVKEHDGGRVWWALTALGAEVARTLAAQEEQAEDEAEDLIGDVPDDAKPGPPPMTKTEAYASVKRAREGLRDADNMIWKGTAEQVREALLETLGATTHLLDALNHEGINGVK